MANHWTDVQQWQNKVTNEIVTAGELIQRYDRWIRVNRLSLCCATFDVRMSDDSKWTRVRQSA